MNKTLKIIFIFIYFVFLIFVLFIVFNYLAPHHLICYPSTILDMQSNIAKESFGIVFTTPQDGPQIINAYDFSFFYAHHIGDHVQACISINNFVNLSDGWILK